MIEIGSKFLATEKIPTAGKYRCVICGVEVKILPKHIDMGKSFFTCPICKAGSEGGPKGPEEDVWEFLGE